MIDSLGILQIAIGLSFVYLLLSLICSAVSEGLESVLKNRSRDLERGLRELLSDEDGTSLVNRIYNHPLISGLFRNEYDARQIRPQIFRTGTVYGGRTLPSYIPSRHFALALMDILLPASAAAPGGATDALRRNGGQNTATLEDLRTAAAGFPNPNVSRALLVMIDASAKDVTRVRENFEKWFDSSMDRVAGWYKRRTQMMIFAVAIASASLLNLDTIQIAGHLATDSAVRSSLAATADEYAKQNTLPLPDLKRDIDNLSLGIPVGWHTAPLNAYEWILKLAGIFASALAASLGAPFWFDILNRVTTLRSSIKPNEKTLGEHAVR